MTKDRAKKAIVAAYVRVSTTEQNLELQRRSIREWAKREGVKLRWYSDKASGTNGERPGWRKLLADIRRGNVAALVCWRLDRVSRSLLDAAKLFEVLQKADVRFVSVTEGVNLDTLTGKMVAGILATLAEWEMSVRRQRQAEGIKSAKAKGKTWGGSTRGWTKVTPAQVRKIRKLRSAGATQRDISAAVGLSVPTVRKILRQNAAKHMI